LALEGKTVFVYSIIPFLVFRPYEQIRNDLCYQRVPVKLVGVGSGFSYGADGGTHHAIDDIGVLTTLPDLHVLVPGDPLEVEKIVEASLAFDRPCYLRLNQSNDPVVHTPETVAHWRLGFPLRFRGRDSAEVVIFSCGNTAPLAADIFQDLSGRGISCGVYSVHTMKPVCVDALRTSIAAARVIVGLEEHVARNGLCDLLRVCMAGISGARQLLCCCLRDEFIHEVGSRHHLNLVTGFTRERVSAAIVDALGAPT
jgi:transketolase